MRKISVLSILPAIVLMSCGGFKPYGRYQFKLGKSDGSHLEFNADLLEEDHPTQEGMKKMVIDADLGDNMSPSSIISQYGEQYPAIEPFTDVVISELAYIDNVSTFYKVLDTKNEKLGYRLAIGSDMLVEYSKGLCERYPDVKSIIDGMGFTDDDFTFSSDETKYFFNAYINNKYLTFQVPISLDDLVMQMIWYGKISYLVYLINIVIAIMDGETIKIPTNLPSNFVDRLPGEKGEARFGTHPQYVLEKGVVVKDEISGVNEIFKKEFSNTYIYDDIGLRIGTLATEKVNDKTTLKVYFEDSYTGSKTNFETYVDLKDGSGDFTITETLKLSVDENNNALVTHNGKNGKNEGFIDENGTEVKFNDLIKEPFRFRDFHCVDVGLTKLN